MSHPHALRSGRQPTPRRTRRETAPPLHARTGHAPRHRGPGSIAVAWLLLAIRKLVVWVLVRQVHGGHSIRLDGRKPLLCALGFLDHGHSARLQRQAALLSPLLSPPCLAYPARLLRAADSFAAAANLFGGLCRPELPLPGQHDGILWRGLRLRAAMVARGRGALLHSLAGGGPQSNYASPRHGLCCDCCVRSPSARRIFRSGLQRWAGLVHLVRRRRFGRRSLACHPPSHRDHQKTSVETVLAPHG